MNLLFTRIAEILSQELRLSESHAAKARANHEIVRKQIALS